MKTKLFFIFLGILFAFYSNAQLRLNSAGDVGIGTTSPGAKLEIQKTNAITDVRINSFSGTTYDARLWMMNNLGSYGFGISGTYGYIWNNVNLSIPNKIMTFAYDGNNGKVSINCTQPNLSFKFYVNGNAGGTSSWSGSDYRIKNSIESLDNCLSKLIKVNGKQYLFNDKELNYRSENKIQKKSIGFIAQEIKEIFPELVLVANDSLNTHFINYDGFIPIIVEAIKEQQQLINNLKDEIEDLKLINNLKVSNSDSNFKLMQNIPNPFNESTRIDFILDNNQQNARICIYDLTGKELKCYYVKDKKDSFVTIKGKELKPGIYIYSLIVGNQIYDTKRMVLTQ